MSLATINNKLAQINGDLIEPVVSKGPVVRPTRGLIYKTYFDVTINRNGYTNNCKDNPVVNNVALKPHSELEEIIIVPATGGTKYKWFCSKNGNRTNGIDVVTFSDGPFSGKTGLDFGIYTQSVYGEVITWNGYTGSPGPTNETPYNYVLVNGTYVPKYKKIQTNCWFKFHGSVLLDGLGLWHGIEKISKVDGVSTLNFNYEFVKKTYYDTTTYNGAVLLSELDGDDVNLCYVPCSEDEWHQLTQIRTDDRNLYIYLDGNLILHIHLNDATYGSSPDELYANCNEGYIGVGSLSIPSEDYVNGVRFNLTSFSICNRDNSYNNHMNVPTYY